MTQPRRRFTLTIKIGADEWGGLTSALRQIETDLSEDRDHTRTSICVGSPDVGYTVEGDEDPTVTHASYFEAVEAWKESRSK